MGVAWCAGVLRPERRLPMGSPIRFDDFSFNVTQAGPSESSRPGYVRYEVRLSIGNQAKRVSYNFRRSSAVLVTDDDRIYLPLPRAVGSSEPCAGPLPAGSTCDTTLVYEVPQGTVAPRFRMSFGAVGDILERIFFGRKAIQLP
jgi:hypothetical protein